MQTQANPSKPWQTVPPPKERRQEIYARSGVLKICAPFCSDSASWCLAPAVHLSSSPSTVWLSIWAYLGCSCCCFASCYCSCCCCCYCCLWGLRKFVQHALGVSHNSALSAVIVVAGVVGVALGGLLVLKSFVVQILPHCALDIWGKCENIFDQIAAFFLPIYSFVFPMPNWPGERRDLWD